MSFLKESKMCVTQGGETATLLPTCKAAPLPQAAHLSRQAGGNWEFNHLFRDHWEFLGFSQWGETLPWHQLILKQQQQQKTTILYVILYLALPITSKQSYTYHLAALQWRTRHCRQPLQSMKPLMRTLKIRKPLEVKGIQPTQGFRWEAVIK